VDDLELVAELRTGAARIDGAMSTGRVTG